MIVATLLKAVQLVVRPLPDVMLSLASQWTDGFEEAGEEVAGGIGVGERVVAHIGVAVVALRVRRILDIRKVSNPTTSRKFEPNLPHDATRRLFLGEISLDSPPADH